MRWIVSHGDTDGICSAAIALSAFKDAELYFSHPVGLAEDLAHIDGDVVICDIALSESVFRQVVRELNRISQGGNKVIYIDHHPLPQMFDAKEFPAEHVYSATSCAAELAYTRLMKDDPKAMPEDMSRVAIFGAIGDYLDKTYEIERLLNRWEKRGLYLESGLIIQAIDSLGRNHDSKRRIAHFLAAAKTPSSDEWVVNLAIGEALREEVMRKKIKEEVRTVGQIAYVLDIDWSLGKSAVYAKGTTEAIVGIGAETRRGFIEMSLRTHSEKIDMSRMLPQIAQKLGGTGGGHPKAAGARIPADKFDLFLRLMNAEIAEKTGRLNVVY